MIATVVFMFLCIQYACTPASHAVSVRENSVRENSIREFFRLYIANEMQDCE